MGLLLLEMLGAALIFVAIIWWTMFSGRKGGELPSSVDEEPGGDQCKVEASSSANSGTSAQNTSASSDTQR